MRNDVRPEKSIRQFLMWMRRKIDGQVRFLGATPEVRLDYWGQTADTYAGFDRFGRVVQQLWRVCLPKTRSATK